MNPVLGGGRGGGRCRSGGRGVRARRPPRGRRPRRDAGLRRHSSARPARRAARPGRPPGRRHPRRHTCCGSPVRGGGTDRRLERSAGRPRRSSPGPRSSSGWGRTGSVRRRSAPSRRQAAGFALAALAVVPVATGRDVLRIGIGLFLLLQAALLVRVGLGGTSAAARAARHGGTRRGTRRRRRGPWVRGPIRRARLASTSATECAGPPPATARRATRFAAPAGGDAADGRSMSLLPFLLISIAVTGAAPVPARPADDRHGRSVLGGLAGVARRGARDPPRARRSSIGGARIRDDRLPPPLPRARLRSSGLAPRARRARPPGRDATRPP